MCFMIKTTVLVNYSGENGFKSELVVVLITLTVHLLEIFYRISHGGAFHSVSLEFI